MPESSVDASFADILKQKAVDIVPPPTLPEGHWVAAVKKYTLGKQENEKQTKYVLWELDPKSSCQDVATPEDGMPDLSKKKLFKKFWITDNPQTLVRLKKFMIACGVDTEDGSSLKECLEMTIDHEVILYLRSKVNEETKEPFNEVADSFVHMDDQDLMDG
jgi:hypothetical protein